METNQWIWQRSDWPVFCYDAGSLLSEISRVSSLIGGLETICRTLSDDQRIVAWKRVLTDDAIETAAIEGEMLRRSSVRASIRKQLGLPVEHDDWDVRADGLVSILIDARKVDHYLLTDDKLWSWHAALFSSGYSGLQKINVGRYRGREEMQIVSGPVGQETVHYVAPPHETLATEMDYFLQYINAEGNEVNPLLKAGIAHLWFIMIHPFDDGNGRIGRAITDYQLARSYPMLTKVVSFSKQISLDKKGYYKTLESAGKGGMDITLWLTWFLGTFGSALQESRWIVDQVVMKARFWQFHKETPLHARQRKVINRLLDDGDKFEGGMTTRKYAGITRCSKVTASRDLKDLVKKKILKKTVGGGRSTSYELCPVIE